MDHCGRCRTVHRAGLRQDVYKRQRVVYLEDYNVTTSERLMPASEVSEQISLAAVSYTHLDVYKRQGPIPHSAPQYITKKLFVQQNFLAHSQKKANLPPAFLLRRPFLPAARPFVKFCAGWFRQLKARPALSAHCTHGTPGSPSH